MSYTVRFRVPLDCLNCGSHVAERDTRLYTSGFGADVTDTYAYPGDVLELTMQDFRDGYFMIRDPGGAADLRALEQWTCSVCGSPQWAIIEFHREDADHSRFVSARSVPLSPEVLEEVQFVSRRIDWWLQSNPGPDSERILQIVGPMLQ